MSNDAADAVAASQHLCCLLHLSGRNQAADFRAADNCSIVADELAHDELEAHRLRRSSQRIDITHATLTVGEVLAHDKAAIIERTQTLQKLLRQQICHQLIKGNINQHIHAQALQQLQLDRRCNQGHRHVRRIYPFQRMVAEGKDRQLCAGMLRLLLCCPDDIKMTAMQTVKSA